MKKYLNRLCLPWILMIGSSTLTAQGTLTRNVMASLQPGEQPMTSESCFALSATRNSVYLVTTLNGKYYAYDNGKRTGPYPKSDESFLRPCPEDPSSGCSYYLYEFDESKYGEMISYEMDGEVFLNFKGEEYGPFKMINSIFVSPDKSWFVATGMDEDMRYQMISADGKIHDIGNRYFNLHVSPTGKVAFVSSMEETGMDGMELLNMDFSDMSLEEIMAFTQEYTESQENAPPPQGFVFMQDGKRFGPYDPTQMEERNPVFCQTGGDHWFMLIDNRLYVDGEMRKDFGDMYVNACDIWLSNDGKRYAVAGYEMITFSDGKSYPNPLKVTWYEKGGIIYLSWVSFENNKDIVLYSRPL